MSGYTKGPWGWDGNVWDYDPEQEAPWLVRADGAKILAGTIKCPNEANARLIAAAPELLEALKMVIEEIGDMPEPLHTIVRSATAKAELSEVAQQAAKL